MKPIDTVTWDTDVETWQFPLNKKQRSMLEDCVVKCDGNVAIIAISPEHEKEPDLFLSRPVDVEDDTDLKFYVTEMGNEPFNIRFGSMPADVFAGLREHDGW